jgi:hypothetical protein
MRYTYYWAKNRDKVEEALEDSFANGKISWADKPQIERKGGFWVLTLWDSSYE